MSTTAPKPVKTSLVLGNLPPKQSGFGNAGTARTPAAISFDNPPWESYRGYNVYSFAFATMGVRIPTILGKCIDDVVQTLNQEFDEERIVDLVACIDRMEDLMEDLVSNSKLRPIADTGEGDISLWNKQIARFFRTRDFKSAPWVVAESYHYRRLKECFSLSKHWKDYDVFFRQKCETFSRSGDAVFELAMRLAEPYADDLKLSPELQLAARGLVFHELTQVSLWGNATDLSLLIDMTEDDIKALQSTGGENLAATEKNILGNDLIALWKLVSSPNFGLGNGQGGRIDFILDNAGFELYCDLLYADFLMQTGLAHKVHFHYKLIAWFVSDVTDKDWQWLLNSMVYGHLFPDMGEAELAALKILGLRWKEYVKQGVWVFEGHPFWISGYTFWDLKNEAPDLFLHLAGSDLLIFKGDLNHRKLTYDCHAPPDTAFSTSIGPLASEPGVPPVLTLRTIKSDVVVGIPADEAERLDRDEPGWKISAKYAVVLLTEGHKDQEADV